MIVAAAIAAAFLVALPDFGDGTDGPAAPEGALVGTILDDSGTPVPATRVGLFDAADQSLVHLAYADELGRFAFPALPARFHIYAAPPDESGLVGEWRFDLDGASVTRLDLRLRPGRRVTVTVLDPQGIPLPGAWVRAFDASGDLLAGTSLCALLETGPDGRASFFAPRRVHVSAAFPGRAWLPGWKLRLRPARAGSEITLRLAEGVELTGRATDTALRPLAGMRVAVWGWADGWRFVGTTSTGPDGTYRTLGGVLKTRVRVFDPSGERVPSDRRWRTDGTRLPDAVLPEGLPLRITCSDEDSGPVRARVWLYSYENRSWWYAGASGADGVCDVRVSARYAIRARPFDEDHVGANLRKQTYLADHADLCLKRARPVDVLTVRRDTAEVVPHVALRAYVDSFVPVGRGVSDEGGRITLRLPESGVARIRVGASSQGTAIRPGWHTLDLSTPAGPLRLELDTMREISGELRHLDGTPVDEPVMVTAWDADTRTETGRWIAHDGTFRISVADRYHLRAVPVDPDSRLFPVHHWWNLATGSGVHERGALVMTSGWRADVQAISEETGAPIRGVRVRGGWPRAVTGEDGWARGILLRPVYSLRGDPPPISTLNPNPIVPDLVRVHETIESDRTVANGRPLPPFRLLTESGTIARVRVLGRLPGGGTGPLPGVRVRAYGGRRPLGGATTDTAGEAHFLAVRFTPENQFRTSVVVSPDPQMPYLPDWLPSLELGAGAPGGYADAGEITLAPAAFGHGQVRDSFGRVLTDRTVSFRTRRADSRPHWLLASGRVDAAGTFWTKLAPRTWFRLWTRFWDQRTENLRFVREFSYPIGGTVDLGSIQLGEAGLVELRCVTSVGDGRGSAAPMPGVRVTLEDAASGEVYDWRRTDGTGDVQLRAPHGRQLRLRFEFWHYAWSAGGVGFDPKASELFEPQFSEVFTLSAPETDFGDVYVVSPLRRSVLEFLGFVYGTPTSAYRSSFVQRTLYRLGMSAGNIPTPAGLKLDTDLARGLISTGIGVMDQARRAIETGLRDAAVREEGLRHANAVLDDLALLYESQENL